MDFGVPTRDAIVVAMTAVHDPAPENRGPIPVLRLISFWKHVVIGFKPQDAR
jgi:hypothetical protein